MRMPVAQVFVVVLAMGMASTAGGQTPPRDPRAKPRPQTGTATIRGRVVDAVTGQPLHRAQVRLNGPGPYDAVATDQTGLFTFTSLPAGRFTVWATKSTYLPSSYPDSTRTLRSARSLDLADGQVIENITVPLYHGAVITGRVVDTFGDPIENVSVQARRLTRSGRPVGASSGGGSNDAGEFRLSRLPAGKYVLVATPNGASTTAGESTAFVPTYYPGVLSPDEAQPITLERGQSIGGLDFVVLEQPVTIVSGIVLDPRGQPASGGNVSVTAFVSGGGAMSNHATQIKNDGTFDFKLPPGAYELSAHVVERRTTPNGAGGIVSSFSEEGMGMARVTVSSEPVSNLVITTGAGSTISGRIAFDGEGTPPEVSRINLHVQRLRSLTGVGMWSDFQSGGECRSKNPARINPDLTFTIEGVQGTCVLNANAGGEWRARSITYQNANLLDRPLDLQGSKQVSGVQVVFTNRQTTVNAEVTDERGAASQDYVLLAFSADKARWTNSRYTSFVVRSSSPPQNVQGRTASLLLPGGGIASGTMGFGAMSAGNMRMGGSLAGLPAGEYYIVALEDAAPEDMRDPEFFEQVAPGATRVTLREGEPQTVQLRRVKAPQMTP